VPLASRPSVGQASAAAVAPLDPIGASCALPSQLLSVLLLRRPPESAQYLAVRYTERLAAAGAVASVGSKGDSYDNALAESFHGLYKTELIRHEGPWHGLEDVEFATLDYIDWFNHRRLHGELGMLPPAEFEARYHAHAAAGPRAASQ
jgi:putative transposase